MSAPHRDCESLMAFVTSVALRAPETCDVYGVPLRNSRGERAVYVGRTGDGNRPYEYLDALAASNPRAALESVRGLPGRLAHLWRLGFRYYGDTMCFLRGVPLSTETAAAFAVESVLGEGRGIGGLLAVDPGADGLQDACRLMRWHDANKCLKCGRGGHLARNCDAAARGAPSPALFAQPPASGLSSQLPRPLPPVASNAAVAPGEPPPAQADPQPVLGAAQPVLATGPAQIVTVPDARRAPPRRRPRAWAELRDAVAFFPAGQVNVCMVRDFVAVMQDPPAARWRAHAKQDIARWRAVRPVIPHVDDLQHVWQPTICRGVHGSPPWLMSEQAAQAVFAWMTGA